MKKLKDKITQITNKITQIRPLSYKISMDKFSWIMKPSVEYARRLIGFIGFGEFMKKDKQKFFSIDFGRAFIKIAYIESEQDKFALLNYDLLELRKEQRKGAIVSFIKDFMQKNNILEKDVCLTISDSDFLFIKPLVLPILPKAEILEAIHWQLKGVLPFNIDDAILDWQIVDELIDEEGAKKNEIMCVIATSELIDRYISIISEAGLFPIPRHISISPFNYANILKLIGGEPAVTAVMDFGYKDATLCIYKNAKLKFMRSLPFSSNRLTQFLMGVSITDSGRIEISYEKAEEIKKEYGILKDESNLAAGDVERHYVMSKIRPFLEGLVKEIKRSFDYFSYNFKTEKPAHLYVTSGGANLKNLEGYLNAELAIPVSKLPIPACIDVVLNNKDEFLQNQNYMMNVLGAALADVGSINLLPSQVRDQKYERIQQASLKVMACVLAGIFLFSFITAKSQIWSSQKKLESVQAHLAGLEEIRQLKQKIDLRENLINLIYKHNVPAEGVLKVVSSLIPSHVLLNELNFDQEKQILILKGKVIKAEGSDASVLTFFVEELEKSPFFREAALVSSKDIEGGNEFEIKCDLASK